MYFSNNSRYVLRKARFLSPGCLNKIGKNLSVKKPRDDPTKPPLRINIPNDDREDLLIRKVPVEASKTGTSLYQDDVFRQPDEIHFSNVDGISINSKVEDPTNQSGERFDSLTPDRVGYTYNTSNVVSFDSINNNNNITSESGSKVGIREVEPSSEKTWFILVDVQPKNKEEEVVKQNTFAAEKSDYSLQKQNIEDEKVKTPKRKKAESLLQKSKRLSKFPLNKLGRKPSRFEVHEVEDEATYILYVRLNRQLNKKPCEVGCVPEKEFTIRTGSSREELEMNELDLELKNSEKGRKKQKVRKNEQIVIAADKTIPEPEFNIEIKLDKEYRDSKQDVEHLNVEKARKNLFNDFGVVAATGGNAPVEKLQKAEDVSPSHEVSAGESQEVYASAENVADSPKVEGLAAATDLQATSQPPLAENVQPKIQDIFTDIKSSKISNNEVPNVSLDEAVATQENNKIQLEEAPRATVQNKEVHKVAVAENVQALVSETKPVESLTQASAVQFTSPSMMHKTKPTEFLNLEKNQSEDEDEKKYLSIHDKLDEKTDKNPYGHNKPNIWKASQQEETAESQNNDISDFQTSSSFVSIGRTETSSYPMMFGAAFPPLLKEALNTQLRLKKNFNEKWKNLGKDGNYKPDPKMQKFSENSILFPKTEPEEFDCESLFTTKEQIILNIIKNDEETRSKSSEITREADSSVDSLSVMKKVKEMVQLDLDNVVKIFDSGSGDQGKELSSVVVSTRNGWEVNREELEAQIAMRRNEMKLEWRNCILEGENNPQSPKYLPSRKDSETVIRFPDKQTKSVMMFNPNTNEFFICKDALAEAISRKTTEPLDEITKTLDILAKGSVSAKDTKSGDSILVFDDETQSWKVDFTILEKRQQQIQLEKELTKRSELILETFEELEKTQISSVPNPGSKDKKTFDYAKREWKDIKNPNEKSTKTKSPFKDVNAEEIRKKNSDLYENLFVAKKKETSVDNPEKKAPGVGSTSSKKESKSADSGEKKADGPPDTTSKKPGTPESNSKLPPPGKPEKKTEDDNFWEAFLKMNILPKDISEIPKNPPKPIKEPEKPKIEKSKPEKAKQEKVKPEKTKPEKKIEVPSLRIPNPFQRRTPVPKKETEGEVKKEIPKKITPPPPPSGDKIEKPAIKAPPPSNQISKEDPKKTDLPKQPPKIDPLKSDISKQPPILDPNKKPPKSDPPKPDPPKVPPKSDPPKPTPNLDPPKQPPKVDPPKPAPKSDPPKQPPKLETSKQNPTPVPPKGGKVQDPKTPTGKSASPPADHYVSDKIIEISRTKGKDQSKVKTKIETVKLNITPDTRLPSKITEINLNKKFEVGKPLKEAQKPIGDQQPLNENFKKSEESPKEKTPLCNKFEKYRTPFSDPEYEEKTMKIKSDIATNPNLKKLDNWNKTLVLHDIMKPPENIETWLKDETDKMATLLLKILQEASDGKPKKKQLPIKPKPENQAKGNPYENIRKKQETAPESFLFRVRTVNFSLENDKKKTPDDKKLNKPKREHEIPPHLVKPSQPTKIVETMKLPVEKSAIPTATVTPSMRTYQLPAGAEERKGRTVTWGSEAVGDFTSTHKEPPHNTTLIVDITEEIPGPEILKKISNTWKLLPVLDSQLTVLTLFRLFQLVNLGRSFLNSSNSSKVKENAFSNLFSKYGPVVNVKGPLSGNVVLIHKPEHLSAVFEQDTSIFVRSIFDSMEEIRKESDEKSLTFEVPTDWSSPMWTELKRATYDSSIKGCEKYLPSAEIAVNSLIGIIKKNRNSQDLVSEDFMEEIKRWSLEALCSILFEKSFGFMEGRIPNTNWVLEPDKLFSALEKATQSLSKCEQGFQMWRLMPTPSAASLSQSYRSMSSILMKQIHQAEINLRNKNELLRDGSMFRVKDLTLVESMLLNDGLTNEEINCNLVDILVIGTSVINSTAGFLLYNLALNVRAQSRLFQELKEALPTKHCHLNYNTLTSLKYLQACVKENLRLHMPIPLFYRLLQNDILLSNYFIPKGTYVVMDQRVSNQKEYVFEDPKKFSPERWLSEEKWMRDHESFASFPLCHGPRSEFVKKVVELQLYAFVAKIIRNFHVEYNFGEIQSTNNLINFPDKPLKLNFIERDF